MDCAKTISALALVVILSGCGSTPMRVEYRVPPAVTAEDISRTAARQSRLIERSKDGDADAL